jgi:hypothetical protein
MSSNLDLDFINRPTFALSNLRWPGLSVLLASLCMAIFTWQLYNTKLLAQNEVSKKINLISHQINHEKVPVILVNAEISIDKKLQIKNTVGALVVPWNEVLLAIEQSDMQDIALLNLEPSSKKQQVIISGEAKNLETILTYIQKLEAQPMLEKVYLQKHNIDEANAFKPVRFTLSAQWLL